MPISTPVPHDLLKHERALSQLLSEICRRAMDGTGPISLSFNITFPAGVGIVLTTPNGLHTYRVSVQNNGALSATKVT